MNVARLGRKTLSANRADCQQCVQAVAVAVRVTFFFLCMHCAAQAQIVAVAPPVNLSDESLSGVYQASTAQFATRDQAEQPQPPATPMPFGVAIPGTNDLNARRATNEPQATVAGPPSFMPMQKPISQISIDVRAKPKQGNQLTPNDMLQKSPGDTMVVRAAAAEELALPWRGWTRREAEEFSYQPLYFEEVNLERYGTTCGRLQPAASAVRFFTTIPLLPYSMTIHRPSERYYWRWPYPAGWSAPKVRESPPFDPKAATVEATVATGMIFLIP